MATNFTWVNSIATTDWEKALSCFPDEYQDIYFSPSYCVLYEDNAGEANCFIYRKGERVFLYPFLLREIPSAPDFFDIASPYGYSGPIYNCLDHGFLREAFFIFKQEAEKRNVIAEVIKFHPLLNNHAALENLWEGSISSICPTVFVELNLDDELRFHNVYSHANRKNIAKSQRAGLRVTFDNNQECWDGFKYLYEKTMHYNQAKDFYQFNDSYYNSIKVNLADQYIIATLWMGSSIISSLLVLLGNKFAHCHLIGTNRDYLSLGGNNLLHHELILWLKARGYSKLHIGGGRGNEEGDSLLKFKKNFSDKLANFYIGENIINQKKYDELINQYYTLVSKDTNSVSLLKYREIPEGFL